MDLLSGDLLRSIWYLHAQPPLWNLIVGFQLKLAAGDLRALERIYQAFSWGVSALLMVLLWALTAHLTTSRRAALAAVLAYALFSAAAYYENYIFYPLFTAFLVVLMTFATHRFLSGRSFPWGWWLLMGGSLVALSWTWSLFHPLLVLVLPLWMIRYRPAGEFRRHRVAVVAGVLAWGLVAFAPSIRNHLLFGIFSNGSWIGLNLAQTVSAGPPAEGPCEFRSLRGNETAPALQSPDHPALDELRKRGGAVNYNHQGYVDLSRRCAAWAAEEIRAQPTEFLKGRIQRFVYSNLLLSDQYAFPPEAWDAVAPVLRARDVLYLPFTIEGRQLYAGPAIALVLCALIWAFAVRRVTEPPRRGVLMLSILLVGYLMVVGHVANRVEQNRMRFTVEPLYILVLAFGASEAGKRLRRDDTARIHA